MPMRTWRMACGGLIAGSLMLAASGAQAQVQRSFINLGFEQPALAPDACYIITSSADVPGWETTHSVFPRSGSCTAPVGSAGPSIELWRNLSATPPRTGLNHAELNAHENSRIYQPVCLANGEVVDWRLSHRGRGGTDVMSFNIDSVANQIVRASTTAAGAGTVVAGSCGTGSIGGASCNAPATAGTWADYSGSFVWNGSSGNHTFGFEAISAGSGNSASGNFLDEIVVILRPYVEFSPASSFTPENQGTGIPAIRVTGIIETTFDVVVSITGGTAVLGTDFSAPGATVSVTIPAGDYGAGQSFPLPFSAIDDAVVDDNRTVTLAIVGDPDNYVVGSTSTCGAAANSEALWTIVDNDVDLATDKITSDATPAVGAPFTYTVTYTNNTARPLVAPMEAHDVTATIADAPPAGVSFDSWTCLGSGGATCPVAGGTGAIDASVLLPAGDASAGGSVTFTITATLDGSSVCTAIQNIATIAAAAGSAEEGASAAADFDTPPPGGTANNTATADVTSSCADLSIVKSADPASVSSGDEVAYTLAVTNNGPDAADGAVLTDPQPAGLDCSAGTLTCGSETGGAVCPASPTVADLQGAGVTIPTFPTGGSLQFTLTCTVTASGNP